MQLNSLKINEPLHDDSRTLLRTAWRARAMLETIETMKGKPPAEANAIIKPALGRGMHPIYRTLRKGLVS
jgi:hypothetical protein